MANIDISKIRSNDYYQINGWMISELKLSDVELQIYAIIYGFTRNPDVSNFYGTINYLSEWTQACSTRVLKALNNLVKQNLIIKYCTNNGFIKKCQYKVNLKILKSLQIIK